MGDGKYAIKSITISVEGERPVTLPVLSQEEQEIQRLTGLTSEQLDILAASLMEQEALEEATEPELTGEMLTPLMNARVDELDNGVQQIVIDTPFDHTYIPSQFGMLRFDHEGGADNLVVLRRHLHELMDWNGGANDRVTLTVYADEALTTPVMELTLSGNRAGGLVTLESAVTLSVDRALLPEDAEAQQPAILGVVETHGSSVTLGVQMPEAGSVFFNGLPENGLFTQQRVDANQTNAVTLTFARTTATGNYDIVLRGDSGRDYNRVTIHWDQTTQQITLTNCALWTPSSACAEMFAAECTRLHGLQSNIGVSDSTLVAQRHELLIEALRDMPEYGHVMPEFEAAFWAAHPEWTDARIYETAEAQAATSGFTATQIRDGILRNRSEEMRVLRNAYSQYYEMMGDLLTKASGIVNEIENGGDERALRMQMQQTIDLYSSSLAVQQLSSIGIRLPSAEELLNIAVQCNETQWEAMQAQVVAEGELADRAEYENQLLSNGFVQNTDGTWVAGPNHNSVAQTDPAIHARTMQLILESEGTGTTQQRLSAYAKANGLSREFVAQTTGINVEESVWVASSNFEWVPNVYETIEAHENPTSENTLIVIIYGSNQLIGSSSGFSDCLAVFNNIGADNGFASRHRFK
jgi:hypothetical protein